MQLAGEGGAGLEPEHGQTLPEALETAPEQLPGPGLVTGQEGPALDQERRVQLIQDHAATAREPGLDYVQVGQHLLTQCPLSENTRCICKAT